MTPNKDCYNLVAILPVTFPDVMRCLLVELFCPHLTSTFSTEITWGNIAKFIWIATLLGWPDDPENVWQVPLLHLLLFGSQMR